jgi:hypothetical protein
MQLDVSSEERNWGMAAHLSALVAIAGLPFGHVLGPLIVYLVKGHESEFVASHAKASLNYQITMSIVGIVGVLALIGVAVGFAVTNPNADLLRCGRHLRVGHLVPVSHLHHRCDDRRGRRPPIQLPVCYSLSSLGAHRNVDAKNQTARAHSR